MAAQYARYATEFTPAQYADLTRDFLRQSAGNETARVETLAAVRLLDAHDLIAFRDCGRKNFRGRLALNRVLHHVSGGEFGLYGFHNFRSRI